MSIESLTAEDIKQLKVAHVACKDDFIFFVRYFFKKQYKRKWAKWDHLYLIAEQLEKVINGEVTRLIINIAPRYGKTELAVKAFIAYGLCLNPAAKFIHLSYSDDLALDNSDGGKDILKTEDYQFMFPNVTIKSGTDSKKKWYTTEGGGVYATSTAGQVTGFGAGKVDEEKEEEEDPELAEELDSFFSSMEAKEGFGGALIIDDPIKPEDAESEVKRDRINARWDSTIKNRVNSRNTAKIVIGQRTHPNDLCGYIMESEGFTEDIKEALADKGKWYLLSIPAVDKKGNALWEFKHTIEELHKMAVENPIVFQTQYMQNPKPKEGLMYDDFETYFDLDSLPTDKGTIKQYIDTADKGKDFLCSIVYFETKTAIYILDVIYTILLISSGFLSIVSWISQLILLNSKGSVFLDPSTVSFIAFSKFEIGSNPAHSFHSEITLSAISFFSSLVSFIPYSSIP